MFVVIILLFEKKTTSKQCVDNDFFSKMSFLNIHFVYSEKFGNMLALYTNLRIVGLHYHQCTSLS